MRISRTGAMVVMSGLVLSTLYPMSATAAEQVVATAPNVTITGGVTGLGSTQGVDIGPDGTVYATDYSDKLSVFAPNATGNTAPLRVIAGANTGIKYPEGVHADAAGYLYVGNYASGINSSVTV